MSTTIVASMHPACQLAGLHQAEVIYSSPTPRARRPVFLNPPPPPNLFLATHLIEGAHVIPNIIIIHDVFIFTDFLSMATAPINVKHANATGR